MDLEKWGRMQRELEEMQQNLAAAVERSELEQQQSSAAASRAQMELKKVKGGLPLLPAAPPEAPPAQRQPSLVPPSLLMLPSVGSRSS